MIFLNVTCINPQEQYTECNFGDEDLEACFETLALLVVAGWKLLKIKYYCADMRYYVSLPVDAFDGNPMQEPIKQLQREWESILSTA